MVLKGLTINIIDKQGNSREDVAEWFREMCNKIQLRRHLEYTLFSWFEYGDFLRSKGIGQNESGYIVLTELRRLPVETFTIQPPVYNINYLYGKYLKGIVKFDDGALHFYQLNAFTGIPEEIKNCEHVKAPTPSSYIDGNPILSPVYQVLPDYEFGRKALKQNINRENIWFLRQTDDKPTLRDSKTSVWKLMENILKSATRNFRWALPANVETVELKGVTSTLTLETVREYVKWVVNANSPADFLSAGGQNKLGGSTTGETELLQSFIEGLQTPLIESVEPMLNNVLMWNGYSDLHVELKIQGIKLKNQELDLKRATEIRTAWKEGHVIASINEYRTLLADLEDASPEWLQKAKDELEATGIQVAQGTQPIGQSKPVLPQDTKQPKNTHSTPEQIQADMKQNQGAIPTREEIEVKTRNKLNSAWDKCFDEVEKLMGV
jgi:hypothetical protein